MTAAAILTRERLIDAATSTLVRDGFAGVTARSIAKTGGINQALTFYHFGSVQDLLLAALDRSSQARMARYEEVLADVRSMRELVPRMRALYEEDVRSGHVDLLCELVAAGVTSRPLGREVSQRFEPWVQLGERVLSRVLPAPLRRLVPIATLANTAVAFFLGVELTARLRGDQAMPERVFGAAERLLRLPSLRLLNRRRPAGPGAR